MKTLPQPVLDKAYKLCADIDKNDYSFVVLSLYYNARLRKGDKTLVGGLRKKNFKYTVDTSQMYKLYSNT
jgi:predicted nucleic acid-binding protein